MRARLQIVLICIAGSVSAQSLRLPARDTNAPEADVFARSISQFNLPDRESAVTREIFSGNLPPFLRRLCPVTVTNVFKGETNTATFFVAPDYLAIGSDENYLLMPVSPNTAQRIADQSACMLPTRKMVDLIYAAAEVKLPPSPIPPSAAMTSVPVFEQHNEMIYTQRSAKLILHPPGTLIAGHKKDVVISGRLAGVTNKVAIYGWHQTNGVPIQPLYLGHTEAWVDYSQGIRLVSQTMLVNGRDKPVAEVLADPKLCGLISDEGVITQARYPTNLPNPSPITNHISRPPESQSFSANLHFDEMIREIKTTDEVRILVNEPAQKSGQTNQPVLLVCYALPNGNTIEQTIGKQLEPGDDWHYDIQHIGAQARWLRHEIKDRTVVIAYLEAVTLSWPAWRKKYSDQRIVELINEVRGIFPGETTELVLASHSGGGSLVFGYLNAVDPIPAEVKRIAFLDSDYGYETKNHADKIRSWLATSADHQLCVLAYQDYLARLNGRTFVSETGGTWGRSRAMLEDLSAQFTFTSRTNGGLEVYATPAGRIEFLLQEDPERKILHTLQVERNGFIQALVSGTAHEGKGYEYLGERAYTNWIRNGY